MTAAAEFVTGIRPDATARGAVAPPVRGFLLAHAPVRADVGGMALSLPRLSRLLVIAATALLALMAVDVTAGLPLPESLTPLWKWHYEAIELLAAGALLLRAAHDRRERLAWSFLALGVIAATCGDLYWDISLAGLSAIPYPSAADALYLAFYPAAYVGLALLLRARGGRFPASVWLDGAVCALGLAALVGALAFPSGDRYHRRRCDDRRHEHRLPDRRCRDARADRLRRRHDGLAPRPRVGVARRRHGAVGGRRHHLALPDRRWQLRRRDLARSLLARRTRARRNRELSAGAQGAASHVRRMAHAGRAGRIRSDVPRTRRLRSLPSHRYRRAAVGGGHDRTRDRAPGAHVHRVHAGARAQPGGGDQRSADGSPEPPCPHAAARGDAARRRRALGR